MLFCLCRYHQLLGFSPYDRRVTMYYENKLAALRGVFGCETLTLDEDAVTVDNRRYPIVDDVIVLLDPTQYPATLRDRLPADAPAAPVRDFAPDIQFSFGAEWQKFSGVLPEHEEEFSEYFDLIDLPALRDATVCDLGCGIGRWSYFLRNRCRQLVLVDFSEAIFVARRNLKEADHALFFMGDLTRLPFRDRFADFLFCLGVLHHLPVPALAEVRRLKRFAPMILVYLYYALDNRPFYFPLLLGGVTPVRRIVSRIRNPLFRSAFTWATAVGAYLPLTLLGTVMRPFGLAEAVPLYEHYHDKSLARIRQDVYDRFFTSIEQRYSREQIVMLSDTFRTVRISDRRPYWHFVCEQ